MMKDKKFIWVFEYIVGLGLLAVIMPSIVRPHPGWSEAHGWAYLLFIACSGITLLGCASAMRQRMKLARRIEQLERIAGNLKTAQSESGRKHAASEHFVGSVN